MSWMFAAFWWSAWLLLVVLGGLLALFTVAFGADDPAAKKRAAVLVEVAGIGWLVAAAAGAWLLWTRDAWWQAPAALGVTVAHLGVLYAAVAVLYPSKK